VVKVIIGIGRTVVVPAEELGTLGFRSYQLSLNSDAHEIDIPDGEFVSSVWMMADGMEVMSIPLAPGFTARYWHSEASVQDLDSIVCPKCGAESFNPNDIREGYCGKCHDWTSDIDCPCPAVHFTSRSRVKKITQKDIRSAAIDSGMATGILDFTLLAEFAPPVWVYFAVASGCAIAGAARFCLPPYSYPRLPRLRRKLKRRKAGQSHEPQ
jgi:ribosomal protein S27AE